MNTRKIMGLGTIILSITLMMLFVSDSTELAIQDVFGLKSKGSDTSGRVGTDSYGSANKGIVCDDRLCSEYPGGYKQFKKEQEQSSKIKSKTVGQKLVEENKMENEMMKSKEMTKRANDAPMKIVKKIQTQDNVSVEFRVPETIVAGKLIPINARVYDASNEGNLSHTDWSYAIIDSNGNIVHKSTTLHGHFGIMNFKDTFPASGTYTIKYTVLSSGTVLFGMPVPELGQTRSVISGDLLKFAEDPKNDFGSRTFEFTVDIMNQGQTLVLDGSEPGTLILVSFSTAPERIVVGQPATLMIDVNDAKTGKDATHVDGLITIAHENLQVTASGDQPEAPIPIPLHGAYHGHLGVVSTGHTFYQSGTYVIDVDLNGIPYSIPAFGQTSARFTIEVFEGGSTQEIKQTIKENTVDIVGIESPFFSPNIINVLPRQTITFDNIDGNQHTITSVKAGTIEPDGKFDSKLLAPGKKFEITLNEKGTYEYFCAVHPPMRGKIIIS
ncbi:cupredoxin domain-containing protein [Candidatus Nitrosotenuis cloacae]|uniref:cupredoxin domain-containing protein n=1 Tax=Candidatus Nitrosotenuis cloacae TaxID=1603555 RepID=UPI00130D5D15|nr:plastocyanin/azurin family copper-binding protein [Candidatus Nitrosotenuis cloacae]